MSDKKHTLNEAKELVCKHELGSALDVLRQVLEDEPYLGGHDRLEKIAGDYSLMLDFMRRGYADEQREMLFGKLLYKTFVLVTDMECMWNRRNKGLYVEALREAGSQNWSNEFVKSVLEGFVADLTMLSLEPEAVRERKSRGLYERHQLFMSRLFSALWTSLSWSEADEAFYCRLLLSPTIDANDSLLILSALTIACLNHFDRWKLRLFAEVWQQAANEVLRQRALVGWALVLPSVDFHVVPGLSEMVHDFLSDEPTRKALLELQIQIFYCMNAERDQQEIQRDIMPTLMKNKNFNVTRFGITEKEDDPMQDILHPEAADKAMEELEQSIQRMMEMQKAGSDIYFGGFSQMKRFPFFNPMVNWFVPFYAEHPGLSLVREKLNGSRFMQILLTKGPFCDSDKYSFALALSGIFDRMPAHLRELFNSEEAMGMNVAGDEVRSPAYIRRMYLQDLYRFFKVFPRCRDLANPFSRQWMNADYKESHAFFFMSGLLDVDVLHPYKIELGQFLLKKGRWEELNLLLYSFVSAVPETADYFLLTAYSDLHEGLYTSACHSFRKVLEMEPNHMQALKGLARACLMDENYQEAEEVYAALLSHHPQRRGWALNRCIALLKLERIDEAVELLYRLDFEYPDDDDVKRILAWGLLWQGRQETARKLYEALLAGKPTAEDFLNAGYCCWMQGEVERAVTLFQGYTATSSHPLAFEFSKDAALLKRRHLSDTEIQLMCDLVRGF